MNGKAPLALCVAVTVLLLAPVSPVSAQSPSKWCLYQARTPDTIVARHRHSEDVRGSDLVVSGDPFPTRVPFRFTGQVRRIGAGRRDFLQKYFRFRGSEGSDSLFQHEIEAGGAGSGLYWFPIQETMLQDFKDEVAPGDSTTLFLLWAGAVGPKEQPKDWIFLINEFTSARSATFWAEELTTCSRP